jgi:D-amino-acid dehydrogenase
MSKRQIHIIGGGIIGLCTAYFLNKKGVQVTVVDKGELSTGASHGNAGMIVPSHFVPMASPGVIAKGIKWMFDSKSPFYIKPRMNLELAQWMWKFYRSCNRKHVNSAIPVLFELNSLSKSLYKDFSNMPEFSFCFEEKGLLMLYKTLQQEAEEIEMANRAHEIGISAEIMTPSELSLLEPNMKMNVRGGLYFQCDAHLYPNLFMSQMTKYLREKGVVFLTNSEVIDFETSQGKIDSLLLDNNEVLCVENVLFSCGSWTAKLVRKLGLKLYIQDGKGYSFTLNKPKVKPNIPTILSEAKVAITPLGNDLRIGGTLEISNFSKEINQKRLQGIIESIPKYFPDMSINNAKNEDVWYGYRPCTPDGMPYIDQSKKLPNVYIAAGHGMMGMSLGPATGKMMSEIFLNNSITIPTDLMKLNRF